MHRPEPAGSLFEQLTSFENLYNAARAARLGKRFKPGAARFHHDIGRSLVDLRDELREGRYQPGPYRTFTIYEPARRFISAAPYRDRVVHHALCQVMEPLFERPFIFDSYANRVGKGTHRALDRCRHYACRHKYVLQGDVRLFFPSIDHEILLARLGRRIHDRGVMELARTIIAHSNEQPPAHFYFPGDDLFTPYERRKGLPIGNLTSQFWANVYLDSIDHYFRDELGIPGYIRYVDNFLVFGDDKGQLAGWLDGARRELEKLRLVLNERESRIYPVHEGIAFLGFRTYPRGRRLLGHSVKRARTRMRRLVEAHGRGEIDLRTVSRSVEAWIADASHGDTKGLRRSILSGAVFRAGRR